LKGALKNVLEDGGFKVTSSNACSARVSAMSLLEWATKEENAPVLHTCAARITAELDTAFDTRSKRSQRQREKMWANFHRIRTSAKFLSQWSSFTTSSVGEPVTPILTQHLTSAMFKEMIKQRFQLEDSTSTSESLPPLSVEEKNALRYAAGYVC